MDDPIVCLFPLNGKSGYVEMRLKERFRCCSASSLQELKQLLKRQRIFCVVIECLIRENEDLHDLGRVCHTLPQIPRIVYGMIPDKKTAFEFAKIVPADLVIHANTKELIDKINRLKIQTVFTIDLTELGIDLDNCRNYWVRKFINSITKNLNFTKRKSMKAIAGELGISQEHLNRAMKEHAFFAPLQLVTFLKHYYSIYLLQNSSELTMHEIAERCGFKTEKRLYDSFRQKHGMSIRAFCRGYHWTQYADFYFKKVKEINAVSNLTSKIRVDAKKLGWKNEDNLFF